jgi:hypothetical protein
MSQETVQKIIIRAVTEPEYRELLFGEPDKALKGYELSEEEAAALKGLERERFDAVVSEVEERVSRAGMVVETPDKTALRIVQRRLILPM